MACSILRAKSRSVMCRAKLLSSYLKSWWIGHILRMDRQLAPYLKSSDRE